MRHPFTSPLRSRLLFAACVTSVVALVSPAFGQDISDLRRQREEAREAEQQALEQIDLLRADAEVEAEVALLVEGLPSDDADQLGVGPEELEADLEDRVDQLPPARRCLEPLPQPQIPVGQGVLHDLAVDRLLRLEVVEEAGPTDPHPGRDVVERRALVALVGEALLRLLEDQIPGGRVGHEARR